MPLPTENLTDQSSEEEIRRAVSKAIEQLVNEGRAQDEAQAIAYDTARKATGGRPRQRVRSKVRMRARE